MNNGVCINGIFGGELSQTYPLLRHTGVPGQNLECHEADVEARMWLDALDAQNSALVKPEQAMVVTQILEAIYTSARTGKEVLF